MSLGIDYSNGTANFDKKNGIHFGVISQHSVGEVWYDSAEADYGEAVCPECGNTVIDSVLYQSKEYGDIEDQELAKKDYYCNICMVSFWSDRCFPEEPLEWSYTGEGYILTDCLDTDIMVIKSPYYTFTGFCSPCVPGAGDLDNYAPEGVKTYCLDHSWFEKWAPYPIYKVEDDTFVPVPKEQK